jgi:hypothetical protein
MQAYGNKLMGTLFDKGFNLGNAVKYILRAGKKDKAKEIEDLKKAKWYLEYHINHLEEENKSDVQK